MTNIAQSFNLASLNHGQKHSSRTERYQPIDTMQLLDYMTNDMGLTYKGASLAKPRLEHKQGFQKHLMIFDTPYTMKKTNGDTEGNFQIIVTNSYDVSTSLQFYIGFFRLVCANGLIAGDSFFKARILHNRDDFEKLPVIMDKINTVLPQLESNLITLEQHQYSVVQEKAYIEQALTAKHGEDYQELYRIDTEQFQPIRKDDAPNNVYCLFNRTQERIIRGMYHLENIEKNNHRKARPVSNIAARMQINKTLWDDAIKLIA